MMHGVYIEWCAKGNCPAGATSYNEKFKPIDLAIIDQVMLVRRNQIVKFVL